MNSNGRAIMETRRRLFLGTGLLLALILGLIGGCGGRGVNFQAMTPDQQLEFAKKAFEKRDYEKSKTHFMLIVVNNPGRALAEEAQFYLAESYYQLKEYLLAVEEYGKLVRSYPQSTFVDDSRYKIALSYYELAPMFALDQEYPHTAIFQLQQFLDDYPESEYRNQVEEYLSECRIKLAKKEYKAGELYRKMGFPNSAIISFDTVLNSYQDTEFVDDAYFWKGVCQQKIRDWDAAETTFADLIAKFPQSEWIEKARNKIKEIQKEREREPNTDEEEEVK